METISEAWLPVSPVSRFGKRISVKHFNDNYGWDGDLTDDPPALKRKWLRECRCRGRPSSPPPATTWPRSTAWPSPRWRRRRRRPASPSAGQPQVTNLVKANLNSPFNSKPPGGGEGGDVLPVRGVEAREGGAGEGGEAAEDGGGLLSGGPRPGHRARIWLWPQGEGLPHGRAQTTTDHQVNSRFSVF